jgi:hypothetical protein
MAKSKVSSEQFSQQELYASPLDLPPGIAADLKERDLAARWISAVNFKKTGGFHKSRWQPYKLSKKAKESILHGGDPEGYVLMDDLILACKPMHDHLKHGKLLKIRTDMADPTSKEGAKALRELSRQHGVDVEVDDRYENSGESEDDEE